MTQRNAYITDHQVPSRLLVIEEEIKNRSQCRKTRKARQMTRGDILANSICNLRGTSSGLEAKYVKFLFFKGIYGIAFNYSLVNHSLC